MTPVSPTISCIIPLYNAAPTILAALASLEAQTFPHWHALIIDDGSTDDGPALVAHAAKRDPRITLIRQPNRGVSAARNTGLDLARADFLHFLDADDLLLPTAFDLLLPAARAHGAAFAGYELADTTGRLIGRQTPASIPWVGLDQLLDTNRIQPNAQLLRRDVLGTLRFDESLRGMEDWDLWLRLAQGGLRWKAVERTLAVYRQTPGTLGKRWENMLAGIRVMLSRRFAELRTAGVPHADLSPERELRSLDAQTFQYATMAALAGHASDPALDRASHLLSLRRTPVSPAEAAQAASTALLFGACIVPTIDGNSEHRWLPPVLAWWTCCAATGHLRPDHTPDALLAPLAAKLIHPDAVVEHLLTAHARSRDLTIIGADANGRRLARAAARRAHHVTLFQGTATDDHAAMIAGEPNVHLLRAPAPHHHPAITPADWASAHSRLTAQALTHLEAAARATGWPSRPACALQPAVQI